MASTPFQMKRTTVAGKVPLYTDLEVGEIALNMADGKIFTRGTSNNIIQMGDSRKYTREFHVDVVNGSDVAPATGAEGAPFATITKALTSAGNSGCCVVLHPGTYTEAVTLTNQNVDVIGTAAGGIVLCSGAWTINNPSSSVRVFGVSLNNSLAISATGSVYFRNCYNTGTTTKTGTGYVEIRDSDFGGSGFSVTGSGAMTIKDSIVYLPTINNSSATVGFSGCTSILGTVITAGAVVIDTSYVYSTTATTAAVTTGAAGAVYLYNSHVITPSNTLARVNFATGFWSINDTQYDKANSTLTGSNLGTVSYWDAINVTGAANTTTLNVSGKTNLNAVGNITITGGANGQVLQTNGSGNLTWATVSGGGGNSISNGTSNVAITTLNGNVTVGVGGNANVLTVTGVGANISGTLAVTGNVTVGNISAQNLGNLSAVNKDGNSSNILYGNGVFATAPVTYGNSNVATFMASYGSNTISTTGNITGGNVTASNVILPSISTANAQAVYYPLVLDSNNNIVKQPVIATLSPVIDNTITTPPSAPNLNDAYLVPATGATGSWSGQGNKIATWTGSVWSFYTPATNNQTTVLTGTNAGNAYLYNGSSWVLQTVSTGIPVYNWSLASSYISGSLVVYNGSLYQANQAIPSNTAFVVGTTGATWSAIKATALAGGSAGGLPYQSVAGSTAFVAAGTSGQLLKSNGTSAPTWVDSPLVASENGSIASSAFTDGQSTTSTSPVDVSGGSFTLPSAGTWTVSFAIASYNSGAGNGNFIGLYDASNNLVDGSLTQTGGTTATNSLVKTVQVTTTGSATYKLRFYTTAGTMYLSTTSKSGIWWNKIGAYLPISSASVAEYGTVPLTVNTNVTSGQTGDILSVTLPSAGTWEVTYNMSTETFNGAGAYVFAWLATTANVIVPNSGSYPIYFAGNTGAVQTARTVQITTTAATTYKLRVNSNTGSVVLYGLSSRTEGSSTGIIYSKIGGLLPVSTIPNINGGAAGQVPYQTAASTTGFTAAGTTGQILQSNGTGAPTWVNGGVNPAVFATGSTTQSIPNNTNTTLSLPTVLFDTNSRFNTGTGRFTPNVSGYYRVTGTVTWEGVVSGSFYQISVFKNGTAYGVSTYFAPTGTNGNYNTISNTVLIPLNGSTDYVEIVVRQLLGVATNSVGGGNAMQAEFVRAL